MLRIFITNNTLYSQNVYLYSVPLSVSEFQPIILAIIVASFCVESHSGQQAFS